MNKKATVIAILATILVSQIMGTPSANADVAIYPGTLSGVCANGAVVLNWTSGVNANSNSVQKGDYYPNDPNRFWEFINQDGSMSQRSFTDAYVTPGVAYSYRIKYAPQTPSNVVTVTCPVAGTIPPTPSPVAQVFLSPQNPYVNSGESVNFTAWGGNGSYSWSANTGNPVNGWSSSFTTQFFNYTNATIYREVVVTSGASSARTWVGVYPYSYATPTPTPVTLQCSATSSYVSSGDLVSVNAWGGNGSYSWSTINGTPSYGWGSSFLTRFTNYGYSTMSQVVTVTSGSQSASCVVNVYGTSTWTPAPTPNGVYIELSSVGRNVTLGQTGEYTSLRARGGDTLDIIVRVRSTNSAYYTSLFVTDVLPSGMQYIAGSTTLNGYVTADGITSSGINIGSLAPNATATIKFSVRVDGAFVPTFGTVTVNNSAQVRADGVATMSSQLPITLSQNASIAAVSTVKTGATDSALVALLVALVATGAYAAYTRTDSFGRTMALAEVQKLSKTAGPNFVK